MMAVDVGTGASLDPRTPRVLFEVPTLAMDEVDRNYDIDPNGQRFLMIKPVETTEEGSPDVVMVENWFEELKRLVPTALRYRLQHEPRAISAHVPRVR